MRVAVEHLRGDVARDLRADQRDPEAFRIDRCTEVGDLRYVLGHLRHADGAEHLPRRHLHGDKPFEVGLETRADPGLMHDPTLPDSPARGTTNLGTARRRDDAAPRNPWSGSRDGVIDWLAVAEGFEPSVGLHPQTLSRRSP